jgi:phosphatidylinositol 3-kinase
MYPAVIQFQTVIPPPENHQQQQLPPFHSRDTNESTLLAPEPAQHALSQSMVFGASSSSVNNSDNPVRGSLSTRMINYLNREKEGPMFKVMVKNGDDLRQDQLIMQMFTLMDRLLKKVNLDLKLTPYRILATGANDGLMEFVQDSYPVSYVVDKFESPQVLSFLRKHKPDPSAEFGVNPEALSTYVKSVAGYCVLTYLLGIGDRHLDNLMMKTEGNLFHIDFGFIFGADPKPYPPPFRLTKEMVEGMGGVQSQHYLKFQTYCCQAFNWLRKSADLILNLLSLMADAGIEELSNDPETTLQKVQEKFRLDLTDEMAEQFFLGLITDSVTALFPVLMEYIHKLATRLR